MRLSKWRIVSSDRRNWWIYPPGYAFPTFHASSFTSAVAILPACQREHQGAGRCFGCGEFNKPGCLTGECCR